MILRLTGTELFVSLPVSPVLRTYMQYYSLQPTESSQPRHMQQMWLTILQKCVQFCDPHLNRSEEIRPKAVGSDIFELRKMSTGSSR